MCSTIRYVDGNYGIFLQRSTVKFYMFICKSSDFYVMCYYILYQLTLELKSANREFMLKN